jgi:spore coat protein U-like protein
VSFGSYDVFSNSNLDSTGTISINCDQFNSFEMSLSPGGGTYASRSMASGANRLNYNLYTDAARTTVWGDGTGGTAIVTAGGTSASRTVYGRIPAKQNAFVGNYSDVVIATVEF